MTWNFRSPLRFFPALTMTAFLIPVILGIVGTLCPAFGYLPAIGATDITNQPFLELMRHPSLPGALRATLFSGICATLTSLCAALTITVQFYPSRPWRWLEKSLAPLLAVPHAAFAIGFTFLIAPSGWIIRLISPTLTGFTVPPDWMTTGDPWALSLSVTMIFKEIPFLLLIIAGGLNQLDTRRTIWVGRSLGYSRFRVWSRLIFPQLYPMLRLPVLAVLAYSLSVVDLALIIGPSVPPTFSVLIDRLFNDPDSSQRLVGAAGAIVLFVITILLIISALSVEWLIARAVRSHLIDGKRSGRTDRLLLLSSVPALLVPAISISSLAVLATWSIAKIWRFPAAVPQSLSWFYWHKSLPYILEPLFQSLLIGVCSSVIAIFLVLGCFENEQQLSRAKIIPVLNRSLWIIYLPLLIPQIGFLFGTQSIFITLGLEGSWVGIIWIHLVFVLPYVFLTLANTYRSYDKRFFDSGVLLSGSAWKSFVLIKLPMLTKPVLFSVAVGFAVSIAQYLPTLYVGAGRFTTITTETVSLASGSDRRIIGVYAICQFILPLLIYGTAVLIPVLLFKNRKAMQN